MRRAEVDWIVYGTYSGFHIFTNPNHDAVTVEQIASGEYDFRKIKARPRSDLIAKLRLGMFLHGVDIFAWPEVRLPRCIPMRTSTGRWTPFVGRLRCSLRRVSGAVTRTT